MAYDQQQQARQHAAPPRSSGVGAMQLPLAVTINSFNRYIKRPDHVVFTVFTAVAVTSAAAVLPAVFAA